MSAAGTCETCLRRGSSAAIGPSDKVECEECWPEKDRRVYRTRSKSKWKSAHNVKQLDHPKKQNGGQEDKRKKEHGRQHHVQELKASQGAVPDFHSGDSSEAITTGAVKPSLSGLKMRVPLSVLIYEEENDKETQTNNISLPEVEIFPNPASKRNNWGSISYNDFTTLVHKIYSDIVHMRRNLFKVPSGKAGKEYIRELTFWLRHFNSPKSELNSIALKAFMSLPTLILQKPSPKSKAKEHSECIVRRLTLWKNGDLELLMKETKLLQKKFISSKRPRKTEDISRIFAKLIMEGKVNAALKFLDTETSKGILSLSDEVLKELTEKHPEAAPICDETLLFGPIDYIPSSIFDSINEESIYKAALYTKGAAGPSGMDAELYRRVLCSKNFGETGKALREEIALMTRNLLTTHYHPAILEAYVACRLIPLNKDPGIRPIGIGEVLRRIIGKTVVWQLKEDIKEAAGPLQTCAGYSAGAEAAIRAMQKIFQDDTTDAVLMIDATNAFNCMNRSVALHNTYIICPSIATYVSNTYRFPSRLSVAGGGEIKSQEGTTQGDPLAMPWFSLNTTPIIQFLRNEVPSVKQVWLADDASAGGKLQVLLEWYNLIKSQGEKNGYYANAGKCWLIVKSPEMEEEAKNLFGESVNITVKGQRHLGAVLGPTEYKDKYCENKVNECASELRNLSEIAKSQPQAAYTAFVKGYRSKFTYFMRTIPNFEDYVEPIQDILNSELIPTLFGCDTPFPDHYTRLFSLPPREGGLGIPLLKEESQEQFRGSSIITESHVQSIVNQEMSLQQPSENHQEKFSDYRAMKRTAIEEKLLCLEKELPSDTLRAVNQARDKGASSWLNAIPLKQQDFDLNKEEYRDALRIRYNLPLEGLPRSCACGEQFNINHALTCKKGGFISIRHDEVRDLLTMQLDKVCHNVQMEPHLI